MGRKLPPNAIAECFRTNTVGIVTGITYEPADLGDNTDPAARQDRARPEPGEKTDDEPTR